MVLNTIITFVFIIHSPYLHFCFLPQDCHLKECGNSYFFKETLKFKDALMMKCNQCQYVFCNVHNHTCKNRTSGRTVRKTSKLLQHGLGWVGLGWVGLRYQDDDR